MPFPNYPDKFKEHAFVSAQNFWKYKKEQGKLPAIDPPESVIIYYQSKLLDYIIEHHPVEKREHIFGDNFFLLKDPYIGICGNPTIGAHITAILVEELFIFSINKILAIGTAGSLQEEMRLGSIIVCSKAIRDGGTSYHYLPHEKVCTCFQ
jgi:hypothetical protein